ncbi:hypothetical protein TrLO_g12686 [Triparma laevis f. longispina]|uniref:Uncharacterized protein n=1 Tax=Triparma laevis f. longispina TaxID=1714387 RepID=A0A9W7DWF4_9STRA|nr:hypothetical protein TrLO_g12686 [Triparma laevis f. longispina]
MSSPPLDSSIWTVSDVLSTMRVRDLKRRLQLTHHYTVKQIDKLMSKQDLINAIIKEETTPKSSTAKGAAAAETVKKFFPGKGDDSFQLIVTLVVIIILIIMDLYLEGGGPLSSFILTPFYSWYYQRRQLSKRIFKYQALRGLFLFCCLILLDLLNTWIRLTVVSGWVLPRSIYYRVAPFLFPMPNLRISTNMLLPANAAEKGGGYGINMFPAVASWFIRDTEFYVKEWIAGAVEGKKFYMKMKKKEARKEGGKEGGGGEKKKKKKKVMYEDDE